MFISRRAAAFLGLSVLAPSLTSEAQAQAVTIPFPNFDPAYDVPGAKLAHTPDPKATYKVVFDLVTEGSVDKLHGGLEMVARYTNTLAKFGVPAERRHIAVVFHQKATQYTLHDDAFAKHHEGHHNPNLAVIKEMKKGGIDLRVCGQGLLNNKFEAAEITPEIQIDLWALTTLVDLGREGYVRI